VSGGDVVQLCDADGQVVLSIDTPLYLQVPGEPERLLGTRFEGLPVPVWWLEVRASARDDAYAVAWRYADDLIRRVGGQLWAPPPRRPPTLTGAPESWPADAGGNDA
jgi:hypothetical protein